MRTSSIMADILYILLDGQCHTLQEIADEIGASRITVHRYVQSLELRHPIDTFQGQRADGKRGVRLDVSKDTALGALTNSQLDLIIKSLENYKDNILKEQETNYKFLINKFKNIKERRIENDVEKR